MIPVTDKVFKLWQNYRYINLYWKDQRVDLWATLYWKPLKQTAFWRAECSTILFILPYNNIRHITFDFTWKTCVWLTHANIQTEGVHPELPLAERQVHRFMFCSVRCNLSRRSDEDYLSLFSHQTLFILFGQLTLKECTVPCCRSICWELPILGIRKSWLSLALRQSKESSAWLNS